MTQALRLGSCVLTSAAIAFATMAHAANLAGSLKAMQGNVLVNAGKGYEAARPGMLLKLGDRVLTLQGGNAIVVQVDGCVTRLAENTAFTLQQPSVCKGGVNTLRQVGPYYAQAIGAPQPGETETDVEQGPLVLVAPTQQVEDLPFSFSPDVAGQSRPVPPTMGALEVQGKEPIAVAQEEPIEKPKKKIRARTWAVLAASLALFSGSSSSTSH